MAKRAIKKKKGRKPTKKSPKELVMELAGVTELSGSWRENAVEIKRKVLDQIAPYLDRAEGESVEDLKNRLLDKERGTISNKKLLKLYRIAQRLKNEFGGKKENLIDTLMKLKGEKDTSYRRHLEKQSLATLLQRYDHAKKKGLLK